MIFSFLLVKLSVFALTQYLNKDLSKSTKGIILTLSPEILEK